MARGTNVRSKNTRRYTVLAVVAAFALIGGMLGPKDTTRLAVPTGIGESLGVLAGPTTTANSGTTPTTAPPNDGSGGSGAGGGGGLGGGDATAPRAVADSKAEDGSATSIAQTYFTPCGCQAGTYLLSARVRGASARAWLTVDGKRVGEWSLTDAYREVEAVVALATGSAIGISSVPRTYGGQRAEVLLDWVRITPTAPQYTTIGRDVKAPNGNRVVLSGVGKGGFEFNENFMVGDAEAAQIRDWGASVVRLFASQEFWNPISCTYDPTYASRLQTEVDVLIARGMYVIIDNHHSQRGDRCAKAKNEPMADDMSVPYWSDVASRFSQYTQVGFDLYNEPHDVSNAVWRNGGDAGGYHTPGMQVLYDTVRATGARNLIFITGPMWGNDLRPALRTPIDGTGIVYAAHAYCFDSCPKDSRGQPTYLESYVAPTVAEYPVAILEFGVSTHYRGGLLNSYERSFNKRIIDWADAHGIGWMAYSWSNVSDVNSFGLLQATGYEPNVNGAPVRNALWAAKGWRSPGGR